MPPAVAAPPPTQVEPVTETLHGVEVTDPYRWLEDQNSPRTRAWIEEQTAYTRAYFDAIPGREQIRERVRELMAFKEVISEPWNVGDRYFFLKRQEDTRAACHRDERRVIRRGDSLGRPSIARNRDFDCCFYRCDLSDARFLAYSVRQGGTDHSALEIFDIERNTVLPDRLPEGFCTGFVFAPDGTGFYYSHRDTARCRGPDYKAALWHRFGTERSQDDRSVLCWRRTRICSSEFSTHPEANAPGLRRCVLQGKPPNIDLPPQDGVRERHPDSLLRRYRRMLRAVLRARPAVRLHQRRRPEFPNR